MKAAIIGGGFAGNVHAAALRSCGVELAAVVTSSKESAMRFAEKWGVARWGSSVELALTDDIDSVHICTPPSFHAHYAGIALRAGKNVFCEKPLSFLPEEAHELAQLAEENGARCTVTYNVRYHMAVQRARELIRSGKFGRPLLIHGSYLQEFHALPAPYDWRYDPKRSGGMRAVTEIGSHWIDTVQYITGKKVEAVSALFGNFFPERILKNGMMENAAPESSKETESDGRINSGKTMSDGGISSGKKSDATDHTDMQTLQRIHVDTEDAACITFRYEDGAIGSVLLSEISPGRGNRLSLEITCENGNLWWNEEENNILHTAVRGEGIRSELFAFGNGFNDTFVSLMQHYYDGKEIPTFLEGAQIVDVCAAIEASAKNGSAWKQVEQASGRRRPGR